MKDGFEEAKRIMGAMVRMKPKPHQEMKVKPKAKKKAKKTNRADRHGELTLASVAVEQAGAARSALKARHIPARRTTMRADRTIGPAHCLKGFAGRVFISEDRRLEIGRHGRTPMTIIVGKSTTFVKYIIPQTSSQARGLA